MKGEPVQGFFAANTHFISHYEIKVNGGPVSHRLSTQLSSNEWAMTGAILKSGDTGNLPEGKIPRGSIEVRMLRRIDQGWTELIFIKNNGVPKRKVELEVSLSCPISDQEFSEEMKNAKTDLKTGVVPKASKANEKLSLFFEKSFGKRKNTPSEELSTMYGEKAPRDGQPVTRSLEILTRVKAGNPSVKVQIKAGKTSFIRANAMLEAREELCLEIRYSPRINETVLTAPELDSLDPLPRESRKPENSFSITSSNSTLNLILGQAIVDLEDLKLPIFGETPLKKAECLAYSAGIPRYIGFFGRDNLITAWQSPLFGTEIYESVLKRLALLQGVKRDDWRDEEINRLPHERRLDPRSETGKINRQLYYGDVTSTPFWILALSRLYHWTGKRELLTKHQTTVLRCCDWIISRLKEGGGLIYYAPADKKSSDENRNQAWKDSGDAIVDHEGRVAVPPLAVAEVQSYAYQALNEAHELLKLAQPGKNHSHLLTEAQALKKRFNQDFWVEKNRFYAIAVAPKGKAINAKASNIGHCFHSGIMSSGRARDVVNGLMKEDLFSGWGIRTLSADNPGYDPFSYHRGSVWPVENALIAHGLAGGGFQAEAERIITAQFAVAALFQQMRLPEVISGHFRTPLNPTPGLYNFANLLQAWSVSAVAQNIQTLLGIRPRADQNRLYLNPHLPVWLQWVELKNLKVGSHFLDIRFWRDDRGKSHWKLLSRPSEIELLPDP
jgi:glycogen debranching enzyme